MQKPSNKRTPLRRNKSAIITSDISDSIEPERLMTTDYWLVASFSLIKYAFMKPSRSPSITGCIFPTS